MPDFFSPGGARRLRTKWRRDHGRSIGFVLAEAIGEAARILRPV